MNLWMNLYWKFLQSLFLKNDVLAFINNVSNEYILTFLLGLRLNFILGITKMWN